MSVASAVDYRELGAFSKPIIESAITSSGNASGSNALVYADILPVGNWLVCGSVEVNSAEIITSVILGAGNGLSPTKYILSGFQGVQFDADINIPFSYCFFSDGTNANDLEVTIICDNAGTYSVIPSPTIQIVRVG